jgi:cystathionine gamma-synthase
LDENAPVHLETIAVHGGHLPDGASGAVAQPITLSVTYQREADGSYPSGYFYSSKGNPNRTALETSFAALEGGSVAVAFASGGAAITAVFRTLAPGDRVLVPDDVFQGTIRGLRELLPKWGVSYDVVDMTDLAAVEAAMQPTTRLIWTETFSNPLLKVTDLRAVAAIAHRHDARCVVDNTFVTPVFQRPLEHGVDAVIHASTKYAGGHGDVLGGIVIARDNTPMMQEIREVQLLEGAVPAPFDCWLLHRGLKTLPYRMRGHAANALAVAQALEHDPYVSRVYYPGLVQHVGHELATAQLSGGFGGIVSIQVRGGREAAVKVAAAVKVFTSATSFGEPESLIQHQASSPTHGTNTGIHDDLLRLSVGLEHPDDLIADLERALRVAHVGESTRPIIR